MIKNDPNLEVCVQYDDYVGYEPTTDCSHELDECKKKLTQIINQNKKISTALFGKYNKLLHFYMINSNMKKLKTHHVQSDIFFNEQLHALQYGKTTQFYLKHQTNSKIKNLIDEIHRIMETYVNI